jgi:hypothetical protein
LEWGVRQGFPTSQSAGLSKKADHREWLAAVVDVGLFRPELERAVPRADRVKDGGPFDHFLMFAVA